MLRRGLRIRFASAGLALARKPRGFRWHQSETRYMGFLIREIEKARRIRTTMLVVARTLRCSACKWSGSEHVCDGRRN